ncbi:MAG TPA: phosphate ABC transporter substrate-binding protein PstS [Bryobacteraceae bacterium]|jgi:phosphate transport system substrate-binding protein|nr:phosphate ABC transporter substrate-binding protein PstS [Bryobacteraceae bacterium]
MAAFLLAAGLPLAAQTSLTGAGATFPAPIYQRWFNDYQSVGNVQINYQPNGSGGGIKAVTEGTVDFGASDMPLTDDQLKTFKDKHGFRVLLFPTVIGADVPTYNVPGVTQELNFTPEALAGIFLGKITTWNDPAITRANPGVKLPGDKIVVVHRSEGSGTTFCWTDYLSKVSPEWKSQVGKNVSVNWPTGIGGKGNDGVAGLIKQQKGALGYVELIYAVKNHLPYGKVQNQGGQFVKADLQSVTAAAASVKSMPADFRVSITDAPGAGLYPISTFTWLLVPEKISDDAKRKALVGFLKWAITTGQGSVESLDYAKLPQAVAAKEEQQIAEIK